MMFLQFFVWGAWYVTAPNYLGTIGFQPVIIGAPIKSVPIAGMITPLFVGLVADRFFSAQKVDGRVAPHGRPDVVFQPLR